MKSFAEVLQEDRRLALLRFLERSPGYEANDSLLRQALATVGLHCGRDVVRTELAWLAEQGLVRTEQVSDVLMARLTERGEDVAAGRGSVPGVRRRGP